MTEAPIILQDRDIIFYLNLPPQGVNVTAMLSQMPLQALCQLRDEIQKFIIVKRPKVDKDA